MLVGILFSLLLFGKLSIGQNTTGKILCGTVPNNQYCYFVNIEDLDETIVNIQHSEPGVATDYIIYFTNQGGSDCINPTISFEFELIDYDLTNEYLTLYDNDDNEIIQCDGGTQNACGSYSTCLTDNSLPVNGNIIANNGTYSIRIYESPEVHQLCGSYSINAELTLKCGGTSSEPGILCDTNTWCYSSDIDSDGETSVNVFSEYDSAETFFEVTFTNNGPTDCINPLLSFEFELIDYNSDDEYLELYDINNSLIQRCDGGIQSGCGTFQTCLQDYYIGNNININEDYTIIIKESTQVHALCTSQHPYTTNAYVTLECEGDNTLLSSTTYHPSIAPTSTPTYSPTSTFPFLSTDIDLFTCDDNDPYTFCYNVNIDDYKGSTSFTLTNTNANVDTTFIITFMNKGGLNCDNPLLTFIFEEIDYNSDFEYLDVFDDDNNRIARCQGLQSGCNTFKTCFEDYQIPIDPIISGENYTITVIESYGVDALCPGNPYSTNSELILSCGLNSTQSIDSTIPPFFPITTDISILTTPAPSNSFTTNQPSPSPGLEPCGFNRFCDTVNIDPRGDTSVIIANEDQNADTYFEITFINQESKTCNNPLLTFIFEEIDYNSLSEYLELYDDNGTSIATCNGQQYACGNFSICLQDYALSVDSIAPGQSYTITILETSTVDALCLGNTHPYSINAELILTCENNGASGCSTDAECGFAFRCDQNSSLCVRDCDSFHIEEYLQCSASFLDVEYEINRINYKIDIIDKNLTNISRDISNLEKESTVNKGTIVGINDELLELEKKWNDTCDKLERFGVNYPVPYSAQSGAVNFDTNINNNNNNNNNKPESIMDAFETKDILIIGALLINLMIGISNCMYKDDEDSKGKKYKKVIYETSDDMDVLSEQQALK